MTAKTPLDLLDAGANDAIAGLCDRALGPRDAPAPDELRACLFAADDPSIVRGDPSVGVVCTIPRPGGGHVRLLVVDPARQGQGHGGRLLSAAEDDLFEHDRERAVAEADAPSAAGGDGGPPKHAITVTIAADAPYYLFPGVETTRMPMICLLEGRKYSRHEANFNMDVDLATIPPDPGGWLLAGDMDRPDIDAFVCKHWDNWRAEVLRALAKGTLTIGRDAHGVTGFCAWNVNRVGHVGPVAVRPDLIGQGIGVPLLVGALHQARQAGLERVEVAWVGPIVPYARVGGAVGRVFFVYKRRVKR